MAEKRTVPWRDLTPEGRAAVLRQIAEAERKLYSRTPVLAIAKYLESFTADGRPIGEVPKVVMETLALHFARFMGGQSLDAAFGGKTATQRDRIALEERDDRVVFDVISVMKTEEERRAAEQLRPKRKRRANPQVAGTPYEHAVEVVAKRYRLGEENVRRIYKKSRPRVAGSAP